jgi:hypothetical protein
MAGPDWLDGAARVAGSGGMMLGGPPRWVWHTYEAGYSLTALNGAKGLVSAGNDVHFTFHPLTGDIVQMLPASQSGKGLVNTAGGVQTNRMGTVCIQVEVIARAARPWTGDLTAAGRAGLARLIGFARAHGIPDVWPAGPPPVYPPGSGNRSASIWTTRAGHYGHSQVPENDHGDPGALDVRALFAPITPPPTPRPIPREGTMLYRATTDSVSPKPGEPGAVTKGSIMDVSLNRRAHIPAAGSPLVESYLAAGYVIPSCPGQDIVDAYPIDVATEKPPAPATVDTVALARELIAGLPVGSLTAADVQVAVEAGLRTVLHNA